MQQLPRACAHHNRSAGPANLGQLSTPTAQIYKLVICIQFEAGSAYPWLLKQGKWERKLYYGTWNDCKNRHNRRLAVFPYCHANDSALAWPKSVLLSAMLCTATSNPLALYWYKSLGYLESSGEWLGAVDRLEVSLSKKSMKMKTHMESPWHLAEAIANMFYYDQTVVSEACLYESS